MRIDLMAGASAVAGRPPAAPARRARPTILVFDSGLGGLTVLAQVRQARPDARYVYVADDAAFPYGALGEAALGARVCAVMERMLALYAPDLAVIACNTASTVVLPALRARFATPFVGVVPPIKPAALLTRSGVVTLLGTPGTVARGYTRDLVATYACACDVTLVGAPDLARYAEAEMAGEPVDDATLRAEIAPCFVARGDGRRTDVVCLSCTHYPLLLARYERLAPWPVAYIDPAPAIARRVVHLLGEGSGAEAEPAGTPALAAFTGSAGLSPALRAALTARGFDAPTIEAMPLSVQ